MDSSTGGTHRARWLLAIVSGACLGILVGLAAQLLRTGFTPSQALAEWCRGTSPPGGDSDNVDAIAFTIQSVGYALCGLLLGVPVLGVPLAFVLGETMRRDRGRTPKPVN